MVDPRQVSRATLLPLDTILSITASDVRNECVWCHVIGLQFVIQQL